MIASSDTGGLAIGSRLDIEADKLVTLSFDEEEHLAVRRPTRGYQGFTGLGWSGIALRPALLRQEPQESATTEEHDDRAIAGSASA